MSTRQRTKLVHEGAYAAEVEVDLIEDENGWANRRLTGAGGLMFRLRAPVAQAREAAAELLGFLEAQLDAEVDDADGERGGAPGVASPVLVRLEGLQVELAIDGSDVLLRYVAGSRDEFEELCEFIREAGVGRA
jgi:hypothetical protein